MFVIDHHFVLVLWRHSIDIIITFIIIISKTLHSEVRNDKEKRKDKYS